MQQMLQDIRAVMLDEGHEELFNDPARILPLHFVQTLENTIRYFVQGSAAVNAQCGEVTKVLACLLEGEVSSNNGEIEVLIAVCGESDTRLSNSINDSTYHHIVSSGVTWFS